MTFHAFINRELTREGRVEPARASVVMNAVGWYLRSRSVQADECALIRPFVLVNVASLKKKILARD